ncbi:uncharacterized protein LOC110190310 [Drosophila serrata]|uniref:uncharacterized protein LOC110190310 n=1 Tax=Drosophila serrata TaxID=7274 RepID=UPI000A1D2AAD|nr:uncharacterized protein LOC110190310 [Drosophila serrata]
MPKAHKTDPAQRTLLTEAEQKERQKNNVSRLQDIVSTCANFKNFLASFKEIEGQRAEKESWDQYMQCDDLPDPKSPVDIQTYLSRLRYYEDIDTANSTNWTLAVDERSVLTQNIFKKNRTRKALEKTNPTSPAPYFEVNVRNCLELLRQMDVLMGNEVEMGRIAWSRLIEIHNVYGDVQREIQMLFDRLTYRVLAIQKLSMKSIDGIVATWSHSAERWRMDIWGLLNVPVIFEQMEFPAMIAELPSTGVQVQMPLSILADCLTVRCVHTSFDHHSKDAKTFELEVIDNEESSVGIVDMEESATTELLIQQELQDEILMKMQRKREEYEELMNLIVERTEMASKKANENLKIIIPKTPKEVRPVPPGMVPDIYEDFIIREHSHYEEYMENYFHPKKLDIFPYEINLREHIIVGGIYSLMFVEAPGQTQFQNFNIVLHHDRRVLRINPDVVVDMPGNGSTGSSKSLDPRANLNDNEQPYFIVTVKLPPGLCKYGKPNVCYFLTEPQRISKAAVSSLRASLFDSRRLSREPSSDNISTISNRYSSIIKLITRQPKYFQSDERNDAMDFELDRPLDKCEMRTLTTHCLPRIISSFKFPLEFNDGEVTDTIRKRTNLIKRNDTTEVSEMALNEGDYDYSVQDQAERMFPWFPDVLPVQFSPDDSGPCNKVLASGVVCALDEIKRQYEEKPLELLQQVEPVSKKDKKMDRSDNSERLEFKTDGINGQEPRKANSLTTATLPKGRRSLQKLKKTPSISTASPEMVFTSGMVSHWTSKYIMDESFDPTTETLTFKTDRLGMFGLAFKRYEHFPFREWCLKANEDNPDEVIFTLSTHHVSMFFYISSQGVRGFVTDLTTGYIANPLKYLEIKEPISDFHQLRQTLVDKNFNIFAETDASFYISNGYFSVKHLASEIHTYNTMALHCRSMKFDRSSWNRLSDRRDIIMNMKIAKDTSDFTAVTMRITPEKTTFVNVSEMCSDNVNDIKLKYEETWRNVNNYVDLNSAILSINPTALDTCNKSTMLFIYIKRLLSEIRPLSYA